MRNKDRYTGALSKEEYERQMASLGQSGTKEEYSRIKNVQEIDSPVKGSVLKGSVLKGSALKEDGLYYIPIPEI
jgi:hypothetical protein